MLKSIIEDWWRHLGCYDREDATGIPYEEFNSPEAYLIVTDEFWNSLTDIDKEEIYEEFFYEY